MSLPVDPARYAAFLGVMAVMAVTPGPANLFAIATGAVKGKRAALAAVAGMNAATLVWFSAAALGLGAIVLAAPGAFAWMAYGGAAYLIWLGLKTWWSAFSADEAKTGGVTVRTGRSALLDGFTVQIANPKIVLFFTGVLPPFLDPERPLPPQLIAFATATIGLDVVAMSAYGLGGAALTARMTEPRFRRGFQLVVGSLLLSAAALMILRR